MTLKQLPIICLNCGDIQENHFKRAGHCPNRKDGVLRSVVETWQPNIGRPCNHIWIPYESRFGFGGCSTPQESTTKTVKCLNCKDVRCL
jgi:hypothetical protein